jgi:hypothetical protein
VQEVIRGHHTYFWLGPRFLPGFCRCRIRPRAVPSFPTKPSLPKGLPVFSWRRRRPISSSDTGKRGSEYIFFVCLSNPSRSAPRFTDQASPDLRFDLLLKVFRGDHATPLERGVKSLVDGIRPHPHVMNSRLASRPFSFRAITKGGAQAPRGLWT